MWIVRLALRRPHTFVVLALLIAIAGPLAILRTPTDIFPSINIPVVTVVWQYGGMSADEMSGRIITPFERVLTTTVNDIDHIESQALPGIGVVKIYFQPGADIRTATAQVPSVSQTVLKQLPPGITPPLVIKYSASSIPVIQLALSSTSLPEQTVFDAAVNQLNDILDTQEVQVTPVNNSAEFARVGYMNLVTKSGTNQFHGRLAYFHQNSVLLKRPSNNGWIRIATKPKVGGGDDVDSQAAQFIGHRLVDVLV